MQDSQKPDLSILLKTLPPMVARKDINMHLGGLISSGYLANLDSKGLGPRALKSGRRVAYIREDLVEWLEQWLKE